MLVSRPARSLSELDALGCQNQELLQRLSRASSAALEWRPRCPALRPLLQPPGPRHASGRRKKTSPWQVIMRSVTALPQAFRPPAPDTGSSSEYFLPLIAVVAMEAIGNRWRLALTTSELFLKNALASESRQIRSGRTGEKLPTVFDGEFHVRPPQACETWPAPHRP